MRTCRPQLPSFRQSQPHSPAFVWPCSPFAHPPLCCSFISLFSKKQGLVLNIGSKLERAEFPCRLPVSHQNDKKERSSSLKCVPRKGITPGSRLEKGPSKETYCLLGCCPMERNMPSAAQPFCLRQGALEEATGSLATSL